MSTETFENGWSALFEWTLFLNVYVISDFVMFTNVYL